MPTLIVVTETSAVAGDLFVPPSLVVNVPAGIVFAFVPVYEAAGALAAVVTVAVMVHSPGLPSDPPGTVPFVKLTVRAGVPERETVAAAGKAGLQVVAGVPVNSRLLFGLIGKVSDKPAPVNAVEDGL